MPRHLTCYAVVACHEGGSPRFLTEPYAKPGPDRVQTHGNELILDLNFGMTDTGERQHCDEEMLSHVFHFLLSIGGQ